MLSITKLQNLKAIHNILPIRKYQWNDVINHKTTKFESNSQPVACTLYSFRRCYQSQNYKIWKQFTTSQAHNANSAGMLSITKLQNLKAIHNQQTVARYKISDVINHKTTKFESNSQLYCSPITTGSGCYQSQNYKIWKQFTTLRELTNLPLWMLSITKLQNLKAIHNYISF